MASETTVYLIEVDAGGTWFLHPAAGYARDARGGLKLLRLYLSAKPHMRGASRVVAYRRGEFVEASDDEASDA